jgi:hypothetical protein
MKLLSPEHNNPFVLARIGQYLFTTEFTVPIAPGITEKNHGGTFILKFLTV